MRTLKFLIGYTFVFLIIGSIVVSCNSSDNKDKPYTPLYVYFNPLELTMGTATLMPYFVNYATDCAKMGLRSYPMRVVYTKDLEAWGVSAMSEYFFLANGRLLRQSGTSFNVGANGFDVVSFDYDENNSNLVCIKMEENGSYERKHTDKGFYYDETGRLIQRKKNDRANPGTWNYIYEYHNNGALKSIFAEKEDRLTSEAGVTLYKMRFDSLGLLSCYETPKTTNIFLKDIRIEKKGKSVTTFTYQDHLCIQAVEKIPIKFDKTTEILTNTSTFTYNLHGDLATWTYSGGVYEAKGNSWYVKEMKFTTTYDYVYDEKGNWTQAKITFPANLDEIPALRTYYKVAKNGFTSSQDHSPSVNHGETACITMERTIEYWGDNVIASMDAKKGKGKE